MSNKKNDEESELKLDEGSTKKKTKEEFDTRYSENHISGAVGVSNTFYDEQLVVNDDSSSVETNDEENADHSDNDDINGNYNGFDQNERRTRGIHHKNKITVPSERTLSDIKLAGGNDLHNDLHNGNNNANNEDSNDDDEEQHDKLPPELVELFQCINDYTPKEIKIEPKLKCFIPNYIPAIGDVDPFIKVPRPDKVQDGLGLMVIDEPSSKQSDAAVLELQLQAQLKKKIRGKGGAGFTSSQHVRSIDNASKNSHEIDRWIESVRDLRISRPLLGEVQYKDPNCMPSIDEMMTPFPQELQAEFNAMVEGLDHQRNKESIGYTLLDPQIDLSLEEYAEAICFLLDVPVVDGNLIQSLHFLFNLCIEYQKDFHDDAISIL